MSPRLYWSASKFAAYACRQCLDCRTLHFDRLKRQGPFILACTHFSHLEPFLLSPMMDRPVRWIARTELYRFRFIANCLHSLGSIPIRRGSRAVRAIRESISQLENGQIVGIFPEAGVLHQQKAMVRGGRFKQGVALIATRAGVPIIPVIMLGTEKLNSAEAWLPGNRTPLFISVGEAVNPPVLAKDASIGVRRAARLQLANSLGAAFVRQYQETLAHFSIDDRKVP